MWPRKQLDIGWHDLLRAVVRCLSPSDASQRAAELESSWAPAGDGLACLSVRSAFDLLLFSAGWTAGDDVLFTEATIADMPRIAAEHGLRPIPVRIDPGSMQPTIVELQRVATDRTRALVVAHLFGSQIDMEPILRWAHDRGIFVIEDCAQAFAGPHDRGHPESDAALYSFGLIKTATAVGGALARVRNVELLRRMRSLQDAWPVQSRRSYGSRLLKCCGLKALSQPAVYAAFVRLCRAARIDFDAVVHRMSRGFAGADFFHRIRHRPSAPLVGTIAARLRQFEPSVIAERTHKGRLLQHLLAPQVECPAASSSRHNFWVFPIRVAEPRHVVEVLRRAGFDATTIAGLTTIADSGNPAFLRPETPLQRIVYLPLSNQMPDAELQRMAAVVMAAVAEHSANAAAPRLAPALHLGR